MELKPVNSNSSLNFLNEIDSSRNAIIHSNEVKFYYKKFFNSIKINSNYIFKK